MPKSTEITSYKKACKKRTMLSFPFHCFIKFIPNMRILMTEDSNNAVSNSFLLDDDSSIPFSVDDPSKSMLWILSHHHLFMRTLALVSCCRAQPDQLWMQKLIGYHSCPS